MAAELLLGVTLFTLLIVTLTGIILIVRRSLFSDEQVSVQINMEKTLVVDRGRKLLDVLSAADLLLPSACGGKGTCGQCIVSVESGGGALLPTEAALLSKSEVEKHARLACQLVVKDDLSLTLPTEVFGVKRWLSTVRSSRNVSTYIREIVFELAPSDALPMKAGSYVIVHCPPYRAAFRDFDIENGYRSEWDRYDLWRFEAQTDVATARAYSIANYPEENDIVMLNVRIATPPPAAAPDVPPGVVSSYLFSLKPGDQAELSGPYGDFFAHDTSNEMIFIGGGAGMAPMRSHIVDQLRQLKSNRRISFFYGARNRQELFYNELFDSLQREHENFSWYAALSDPRPEDNWNGPVGLIHQVAYDRYLKEHPNPELCEFYVCGPPLMNAAVLKMLDDLGVERTNISLDDFGI